MIEVDSAVLYMYCLRNYSDIIAKDVLNTNLWKNFTYCVMITCMWCEVEKKGLFRECLCTWPSLTDLENVFTRIWLPSFDKCRLRARLHWASASMLQQCCDEASKIPLIENNGVAPEWGCFQWQQWHLHHCNIVAALTLTLSVNGLLLGLRNSSILTRLCDLQHKQSIRESGILVCKSRNIG